ncbi:MULTISPECIES: hypothetical protein [unclassified Moorena]|uniref:Uncharacterized protein n=1 Tax=Moorena producens 3L TaxID=489825 RepID=F4XN64_9CYAN|nr:MULTISPECIES: hypothetical protein [unclassified Moorena]EGJ34123.1 hypothetical protein LYNGBM3L_21260 [Moorena producens 3L]NEQ15544.1 hypothetical protein [Moorena sp. SIO3E2]NES41823.1 hypothetical protein [Moorena sp. SIO2C4]NEP34136.1 hypothetical protein [Moorena sp. SIO3B2]NEQ05182.1 hypothetical protein [Moorena sp. SIO4E2]
MRLAVGHATRTHLEVNQTDPKVGKFRLVSEIAILLSYPQVRPVANLILNAESAP